MNTQTNMMSQKLVHQNNCIFFTSGGSFKKMIYRNLRQTHQVIQGFGQKPTTNTNFTPVNVKNRPLYNRMID